MILKIENTDHGIVFIDGIEQLTNVGTSTDNGDTIKIVHTVLGDEIVTREKNDVLYDIVSIYNLGREKEKVYVFNLVLRNTADNRKEYRSILFKGPGFLMNDAGYTVETYKMCE